MDVTGGSQDKAKEKMDKLDEWINKEQSKVAPFQLHGFVLAPLCTGDTISRGQVKILRHEAVELLGGLAQVLRWYHQ